MSKIKDVMDNQKIKKLLSAKTPEEYIDNSVKSKLPQRDKARATKIWLEQTDFTIEDISYARNRHPYWKAIKQKNHQFRTRKRFSDFNYSTGNTQPWTIELLKQFLEVNDKITDRELAQQFKRSLPSIQAIRRRINLANRIFELEGAAKVNKSMILKKIVSDEKVLRKKLNEIKDNNGMNSVQKKKKK
ncbi:MAG: hypothetical protein OEV78_03850 [Spirochaetia bacterium]|nr:hypothetical protein [Spirochaetia bacterium]